MKRDVLDHGYVELVESWGGDESIIEAARMSTGKGFLGWGPKCVQCDATAVDGKYPKGACPAAVAGDNTHAMVPGDEKLLAYLWNHNHATPFEMAGVVIEVKAPIFVFREWHRHRTQSYNEMSARYIPLPDENYIPSVERLLVNSKANKQAGVIAGAEVLTEQNAKLFRKQLGELYATQQNFYELALHAGVPKELARVHLPVGRYSRMRASANLRNWLGFLTLRLDAAAQWEIRQYAEAVGAIIADRFPRTWELFEASRGAK